MVSVAGISTYMLEYCVEEHACYSVNSLLKLRSAVQMIRFFKVRIFALIY
jgi:hypothetical protein